MTVQSKTVIKSYFQTNDRPTEAQFADFIDSYQDVNSNLTLLASAGTGTTGLALLAANTPTSARSIVSAYSENGGLISGTVSAAGNVFINGTLNVGGSSVNGSGRLLGIQYFGSNGTYTPTAGTSFVIVHCVGAGGSGARSNTVQMACGGAGGGYGRKRFNSGFSGVSYTVGAGGTVITVDNTGGNTGGTTTFSTLSVTGGAGGSVGANNISVVGGLATGADLALPGGYGAVVQSGTANQTLTIGGAAPMLGAQIYWAGSSQAGQTGLAYGGGGTGSSTGMNSGGGASGVIVIEEYS